MNDISRSEAVGAMLRSFLGLLRKRTKNAWIKLLFAWLTGAAVVVFLAHRREPTVSELVARLVPRRGIIPRAQNGLRKVIGFGDLDFARSNSAEEMLKNLGRRAECAVPELLPLLSIPEAAPAAARCLVYTGPVGTELLLKALEDKAATNRSQVLRGLVFVQAPDPRLLTNVHRLAANFAPRDRALAFEVSLSFLRGKLIAQKILILEGLNDSSREVRGAALSALKWGNITLDPVLLSAVRSLESDPDPRLAEAAQRMIQTYLELKRWRSSMRQREKPL